jgi:hypothetical protein
MKAAKGKTIRFKVRSRGDGGVVANGSHGDWAVGAWAPDRAALAQGVECAVQELVRLRIYPRGLRILLLCLCIPLMFGQAVLTITKTPYEQFDCSMDFVQVIGTDAMTLDAVAAANVNGVDTSSDMISSSPVPAIVSGTKKVVFRVKGGRNGETHRISIKVVNSVSGEKFEGVMMLKIAS